MKLIFRSWILVLVFSNTLSSLQAGAATTPLETVNLVPSTAPMDIHTGLDGRVYVMDSGMGMIWRIQPADGSVEQYFLSWLNDALGDASGALWWTDGADAFGYFNTTGTPVTLNTWTAPPDSQDNKANLGPLDFLNGKVWLATWISSLFGIYSFTPDASRELCHYAIPGGAYATDLMSQGGSQWWLNWSNGAGGNSLNRLTADGGAWTSYPLGREINQRAGMLVDGNVLWWAEDVLDGKIARFDTLSGEMRLYSLPAGAWPLRVALLAGNIWYADANGSFGRLSPQSTAYTTATLTPSTPQTINPTCQGLALPAASDGTPMTDTLTFSTGSSVITQPLTGLEVYSLPAGATPVGITIADNKVWLLEGGDAPSARKMIDRLTVAVEQKLFLPMVRR